MENSLFIQCVECAVLVVPRCTEVGRVYMSVSMFRGLRFTPTCPRNCLVGLGSSCPVTGRMNWDTSGCHYVGT
ncbi:hypothetical protein E2C01_043617 [Portunus trituberculatus]|uniref:Uncharacterized protein n=1 Tax=Portunus trituberculatus TaxID=210409 RepID=A0A5B7FXT2_PORTR|nr:hypothetical protein [Portunus trituberculatus]